MTSKKTALAKPKKSIQIPNTAYALRIIQLARVDYKHLLLEYSEHPDLIHRAKITALLLSKLLQAYDVKAKIWHNAYIFITVDELVEMGLFDTNHGIKYNMQLLNKYVRCIHTARLVTVNGLVQGDETAFNFFSCQIPFEINNKFRGYALQISDYLPMQGLYRQALKSYGNAPAWIFDLSNDAFLVAYFLGTHKTLAKKSSYQITMKEILEELEPTLGMRSKSRGRPTTRIQKAIDEINGTSQREIQIFEEAENEGVYTVVVSKTQKYSLKNPDFGHEQDEHNATKKRQKTSKGSHQNLKR